MSFLVVALMGEEDADLADRGGIFSLFACFVIFLRKWRKKVNTLVTSTKMENSDIIEMAAKEKPAGK